MILNLQRAEISCVGQDIFYQEIYWHFVETEM